jgi:hypothetical protein
MRKMLWKADEGYGIFDHTSIIPAERRSRPTLPKDRKYWVKKSPEATRRRIYYAEKLGKLRLAELGRRLGHWWWTTPWSKIRS